MDKTAMTEKEAEALPRILDGLVEDAMKWSGMAWAMADELDRLKAELANALERNKCLTRQIEALNKCIEREGLL